MIAYKIIIYVIYGLLLSICISTKAQILEEITLSYCYDKAVVAYPLISDKESLKKASELRIKYIESAYLPQLSLNGQATYQSDVTKINLPPSLPISISGPDKDQYKITLDAQQVLYDGGLTRKQKKLEQATSAADIQQIEADILRIKEQVNNTFFYIIVLQQNKELFQNVLNVLIEKEKTVKSMVKNGVLLLSDENTLIAERLKTEQQITEIDINRNSAIRVMNLLTNENFNDSTRFLAPDIIITDTVSINRPELETFELQEKRLDAASSLTHTSLLPKLYAFGQYGYGKPGLNMLSNEFDDFYIVGATLKWNFWDWNKSKHDRQVYAIQKDMISSKRDNFNKNLNIDLQNRQATIQKLEIALIRDKDIVKLRESITKIAHSQLNNGVITSTDFVNELNNETQAKLNFETHKIQLAQAKAGYLLAKGL